MVLPLGSWQVAGGRQRVVLDLIGQAAVVQQRDDPKGFFSCARLVDDGVKLRDAVEQGLRMVFFSGVSTTSCGGTGADTAAAGARGTGGPDGNVTSGGALEQLPEAPRV